MRTLKRASTVMIVLVLTVASFGQSRKPGRLPVSGYLVSARAGGVNMIQGDVSFKRDKSDWDMLIAGDELNDGDVVKTGSNGRLELLLNPGSYLRVSGDAELVLSNTSLDDLNVNLKRGSFILEAAAIDGWTGTLVTISTPTSAYRVAQGGLYRFNVEQAGQSEALVFKGKLIAGGLTVKDGRKVTGDAGNLVPVSFNKKLQDDFDLWSKDRANTLIAANRRLSQRALMGSGLGFFANSWFFSSMLGSYTFLPGFYGYRSPYGGGYNVCNPRAPYSPGLSGGRQPTAGGTNPSAGWGRGGNSGTITRSTPPAPPSSSAGRGSSGGSWGAAGGGGGTINRPAPSAPRGRP